VTACKHTERPSLQPLDQPVTRSAGIVAAFQVRRRMAIVHQPVTQRRLPLRVE
jgi:hypothetical protein